MKKVSILIILFSTVAISMAQDTAVKTIQAIRITTPPKIDGLLDDSCWMNITPATDFIQSEPNPMNPSRQKTEVKFVYDNNAIYVGAFMYDTHPDSILHELSKRENVFYGPNADAFGILIDSYKDGLNAVLFAVSSAGVQADTRVSDPDNFDDSWNVVWESKAKINDKGWVVEMRIPYSALRFPKKDAQEWGINFSRQIRRCREFSNWNPVNPEKQGFIRQSGILNGITNIDSPLRLSFSPYISSSLDIFDSNTAYSVNGGADIKYGINESFTMDMTLIPDFGQVKSDAKVLNLSPFETRYDEQRSFFTEGTELFNTGGLFYSRRIGGEPMGYENAYNRTDSNEIVEKNPVTTQLYNATKISGRTKSKLGIGLFNAITAPMYATILDTLSNASRKILTQPLTNYNVFVLEQGLKNNSFISFINTNVTRDGSAYDANVTGCAFKISNKSNSYFIGGLGNLSQLFYADSSKPVRGSRYVLTGGKSSGNYTFSITERFTEKTFNPNDMGYNDRTNEFNHFLNQSYNIYKPFWIINKMSNDLGIDYYRVANPSTFTKLNIDWATDIDFKNYFTWGVTWGIRPVKYYDYYEPRTEGRYYQLPLCYDIGTYFSSDSRKKFTLRGNTEYMRFNERNRYDIEWSVSPRYRFSDKFNMSYSFFAKYQNDNVGWADNVNDTIIFGVRNVNTNENSLEGNYIFTSTMSLSLIARHYWSQVKYKDYFALNENGKGSPTDYNENNNINFNAVTVDMIYTWQFAPASEMSIVWKNAIFTEGQQLINDYFDNFNKTFESPQLNSFSMKILYYLDSQSLKRKKKTS